MPEYLSLCMKLKCTCVYTHAKLVQYLFWWIQERISHRSSGLNVGWHRLVHSYTKMYQSRTTVTISDFSLLPKNLGIFESSSQNDFKCSPQERHKATITEYSSYNAVSLRKRTSAFIISISMRKRIWLCLQFAFHFSKLFN